MDANRHMATSKDMKLCHDHVHTFFLAWMHQKNTALCLPLSVDSCYSDIVRHELIGQCQSEVRAAAASCINRVSRCHCWLILNLIVDGSIGVEWGGASSVQCNCMMWFQQWLACVAGMELKERYTHRGNAWGIKKGL